MGEEAEGREDGALSAERAAQNEVTFRDANEQLEQRRQELGVEGDRYPFLCECDQERCTQVIFVTEEEYQAARSSPRRFLVVAGHDPDSRVISSHDGFVMVEKDGREGELVEELSD